MKSLFTLICIILFFNLINAQPLNNGFENWNSLDPVDWSSSDDFGGLDGITESSDAHSGSSSARLEPIDIGGGFIISSWLWSVDDNGNYHSVSEKHGSLKGWYKFSPQGSDWFFVTVGMMTNDSTVIGAGSFGTQSTVSTWTEFTAAITYLPGSPDPTQTFVVVTMYDTTGQAHAGTFILVDDLSFTGPSDVRQISGLPEDYILKQNYPNPFNPSTKIEYSIPEASFVQLRVYNILGNEVAILVNEEQPVGTYRADFTAGDLASGIYIAQLKAGNFSKTIKMSFLK